MERHRYGPEPSQYAELARPDGVDAPPVAVLIHGGFWKAQYACDQMHRLANDLGRRGWAAWNLEYRRLGDGDGGGWPATCDDVAAGIDRLAELDGLDLGRVIAIGHSAGGHLAAWAATRDAPRVPVTGVVSQAGVLDLRLAWDLRLSDGVVERFLGGTPDQHPDRSAAASPRERLPLGVPVLLTHGERDDTVPARMSREFAEATSDPVQLRVDPHAGHMEHIDPRSQLWKWVTEWL